MMRLPVLIFACTGALAWAEAECGAQEDQEDDVGLLQVSKHSDSKGTMDCPHECMHPQCNSGVAGFSGAQPLVDDKCFFYCATFGSSSSQRWCGEGANFVKRGSVDCKVCKPAAVGGEYADFKFVDHALGSIKGKFLIDKVEQKKEEQKDPFPEALVEWKVEGLQIDPKLVAKACGKLLKGKPTFHYHLHEEWNFPDDRTSSAFDCSLENVGNHWDPTAACGPASGNKVCDKGFCDTRGQDYTCNPKFFNPNSRAQYRLLSPSALFPKDVTCEFGDFSGMTGPIEAELGPHGGVVQEKPHDGKAAMSATFGTVEPDTLENRPFLACRFGTLPKSNDLFKKVSFEAASKKSPLDQFPTNASVLVHCGDNYANSNARFFCALLQDGKKKEKFD